MEQQRRMIYTPTRAVPRRFLHVLCFALSFFITVSCIALAEPPHHNQEPHCPKNCKDLPIEYPFGAALGCGSPGFLLDCNVEGDLPAWVLPVDTAQPPPQYFVVDVEVNNHYNGSFYIRDAAMSDCTDVHSAENRVPLHPSSLKFAEFSMYSQSVDILVFDCPTPQPGNPPGFTDNSPVCNAFVTKCCRNRRDTPTKCFLTHSIDADFGFLMSNYSCSSYTVLSNVSTTLPSSFPSPNDTRNIHIQWSNLVNASACDKCMQSNGTCGYDVDDHESNGGFRCLCPGGKSYSTACPPGCRGIHCRSIRDLAIALPVVALALIGAGTVSCKFWRRKKHTTEGNSPIFLSNDLSEDLVQVLADQVGPLPTKLFTYKELQHATKFFCRSRMVGDGGFGAVYKGRLYDGRKVAVKRLFHDNYRRLHQFFNEIRILSSLQHPNLVKLYGFCYEDDRDLLLVYEFVSNGTLADHLHGDGWKRLLWDTRLSIAVETAQALAYLHSCVNPQIFHRDIKSSNILLDENSHVKVADFGLSRLVPPEASHVSTAPQGTPGYLDPEYHQCYQLTDKSDVYSFGVLLMEIISSKRAVDVSRDRKEINLSNLAVSKIQSGSLDELVDPLLEFSRNPAIRQMVTRVAGIGLECLALDRDDRPSMTKVSDELEKIRQFGCSVGNDQDKFESIVSTEFDKAIKPLRAKFPVSPNSVQTEWSSSSTSLSDGSSLAV